MIMTDLQLTERAFYMGGHWVKGSGAPLTSVNPDKQAKLERLARLVLRQGKPCARATTDDRSCIQQKVKRC